MIQLKQSKENIFAVPVPEDATNICVFKYDYIGKSRLVFSSKIKDPFNVGGDMEIIDGENLELIGTITKDVIDFDAEPFVENVGAWGDLYRNYQIEEPYFDHAKDSFYSLMRVNELYFENPYGEKEPEDISDLGLFTQIQRKQWREWETAQQRMSSKWAIIKKI